MSTTQGFIAKFTSSPPSTEDSIVKEVSGNIGVGTTTPGAVVDVYSAGKTQLRAGDSSAQAAGVGGAVLFASKYDSPGNFNTFGKIALEKANATSGNYDFNLAFYNSQNGGANPRGTPTLMLQGSNDSVGVGTTTPIGRLTVKQDSEAVNKGIRVERSAIDASYQIYHDGSTWALHPTYSSGGSLSDTVFWTSTGGAAALTIKTDGSVVVGDSLNLSGLRVKYVPFGTNTVSDAVTAMSDGDCLVLGAGTYTQSVAIAIPTSVTRFSIIGQGSAVSIIKFTANVDGIYNSTANDVYRIQRAILAGFSMAYSSGTTNDKTGIKLWGTGYNNNYRPGIVLADLAMTYVDGSNNDCWLDCIRLIDCRVVTLEKILIRRQASGTTVLGYKCLSAKINTVEFAGVSQNAIFEDVSEGPEAGGHHLIDNVYVDPSPGSWSSGSHVMHIKRPGTVVHGCHFHFGTSLNFNAITFDGASDGDLCTASDNVILECGGDGGSGIYITGNYCKATGNTFINTDTGDNGADIKIETGASGNLVTSNMIDYRIVDGGTGTVLANNPTH